MIDPAYTLIECAGCSRSAANECSGVTGAPRALVVGGTHTKMPPTLAEVMKKKSPSDWMFPATIESGSGPCQRGYDGQLKAGGCTP